MHTIAVRFGIISVLATGFLVGSDKSPKEPFESTPSTSSGSSSSSSLSSGAWYKPVVAFAQDHPLATSVGGGLVGGAVLGTVAEHVPFLAWCTAGAGLGALAYTKRDYLALQFHRAKLGYQLMKEAEAGIVSPGGQSPTSSGNNRKHIVGLYRQASTALPENRLATVHALGFTFSVTPTEGKGS